MVTETMNIHKALCELKTIDSRINKLINVATFCVANKHSNQKIGGTDVKSWCEDVKSSYQKIKDLIERREAIKRGVILSNAKTEVAIGSKTYTVAEAIDMKNHGLEHLEGILLHMTAEYNAAKRNADNMNGPSLDERANNYIATLYGTSDMKGLGDEVQKVRSEFIESQTYEIIDPLKILEKMEQLEEQINTFKSEVDSALSVSNALTSITIEYGDD